MTQPQVSIVIPTRDAGEGFHHVLAAIRAQEPGGPEVEIVIVDSGSTDATLEIGLQFGARVILIPGEEFNHGETRNLGVGHSRGRLVGCLVQDARPANSAWLAPLVAALEGDPQVAGAYSRQLPWPGDDPLTQFLVGQWHQVQGGQRVRQSLPASGTLADLPFAERRRACAFDNVSSLLRRKAWEQHPFRRVRFAEDVDWARRVLQAGMALVYEPDSQVYHSHVRPFVYNLRRQYVDERILLDALEADGRAIRAWNSPRQVLGLVQRVLTTAHGRGAMSPALLGRLCSFSLAILLGSAGRRAVHPRLRSPHPPSWSQRADAWFLRGM
jgi:rhamnosyltransferase